MPHASQHSALRGADAYLGARHAGNHLLQAGVVVAAGL